MFGKTSGEDNIFKQSVQSQNMFKR